MSFELKNCPYCGGEAEMCRTNDNQSRPFVRCKYGTMLTPICPAARAWMWDYGSEEEATQAWNRRCTDVVRCRDCKHCEEDVLFGSAWCNGRRVTTDWFCADGERREHED